MSDFASLVMLTCFITVAGTEGNRVVNKKDFGLNPVLGGFFLGLALFIFGLISENLATKFCYLVLVTGLLINGASVFNALRISTNNK